MKNIIFQTKPLEIFVALKSGKGINCHTKIVKHVGCIYSYCTKIIRKFEKMELVKFEKKGKIKIIELTPKGEEVADLIILIKRLLK